jgi:hypothetical protein
MWNPWRRHHIQVPFHQGWVQIRVPQAAGIDRLAGEILLNPRWTHVVASESCCYTKVNIGKWPTEVRCWWSFMADIWPLKAMHCIIWVHMCGLADKLCNCLCFYIFFQFKIVCQTNSTDLKSLLPDNNIKCWILYSLVEWMGGGVNYSLKCRENKYFGKQCGILLNVKHKLWIYHVGTWGHNISTLCLHVYVIAFTIPGTAWSCHSECPELNTAVFWDVTPCSQYRFTVILGESVAPNCRAQESASSLPAQFTLQPWNRFLPTWLSLILKMEALCSSKTVVNLYHLTSYPITFSLLWE